MPKGGAGRGQGNKPLPPEIKKSKRITVNLDEATAAKVDELRGAKKAPAWILSLILQEIERQT